MKMLVSVSNAVLDKLALGGFTEYEYRCLLTLIGWGGDVRLPLSGWESETGIDRRNVWATLRSLRDRRVISIDGDSRKPQRTAINLSTDEWIMPDRLSPDNMRARRDRMSQAERRRGAFNAKRDSLFLDVGRRDGFHCVECLTTKDLTLDHKIPISAGGTDDQDNLQIMCRSCNARKGGRS